MWMEVKYVEYDGDDDNIDSNDSNNNGWWAGSSSTYNTKKETFLTYVSFLLHFTSI